VPGPVRASDGKSLRFAAVIDRADGLDDFREPVQQRHDVVAITNFRDAKYPELLVDIKPGYRIQRVDIGCGATVGIGSLEWSKGSA
jgi:hypothetical protein